jgi:hypothetical protein
VLTEELAEMAEESRTTFGGVVQLASHGEFSGFGLEFVATGVFWRRWWLSRGDTMLFVTYNTDAAQAQVHRDAVDLILSSLKACVKGRRTTGCS